MTPAPLFFSRANDSISKATTSRQLGLRGDIKAEDVLRRLEAIMYDLARLGDPSADRLDQLTKDLTEAEIAIQGDR